MKLYKQDLGSVFLKNHRLYWIKQDRYSKQEVDITPIWHFFQDIKVWDCLENDEALNNKVLSIIKSKKSDE